ncbi:MAG: PLDc N-terminal domain-containing protein [Verrucomicrobiae bacterium]|nr:PLDc N-terminal domain-containing protein [Verrucomicrobiae bacterium]
MPWLDQLARLWPHLVAALSFFAALLASAHALLNKRDSRAAVLWLGFIWLMPLLGPILYVSLGVNRIRRKALTLRAENPEVIPPSLAHDAGESDAPVAEHLRSLARLVERVAARPLAGGNRVQVLVNGDEAFPAMLAAIDGAKKSVALLTYIFDRDPSGRQFVAALGRAVARGVAVRVLIDDAGARYSWPTIFRELKRARVPVGRFLPSFPLWHFMTMNLRNHRKLLVADGAVGFTGGINIRQGNVLAAQPRRPVQDLHFRLEGPVVTQMQEAFANDWAFCTDEILEGHVWFPELCDGGKVVARVVTDGPDEDYDKLRWTLLAALAEAQSSVQIVTPYFLPDPTLITALNLAALRGVRVDIILPANSNLPFVDWASRALWWQVLERGCRLWLTPPPFDHSKLMVVDGHWVFVGSANWDPRSLRLNFELNVECYDRDLAQAMSALAQGKIQIAREVTLAEADGRAMPAKLRDATARLFSPFL